MAQQPTFKTYVPFYIDPRREFLGTRYDPDELVAIFTCSRNVCCVKGAMKHSFCDTAGSVYYGGRYHPQRLYCPRHFYEFRFWEDCEHSLVDARREEYHEALDKLKREQRKAMKKGTKMN